MADDKRPPYEVGISTGFWKIGKDPALLGLAQKIGGLGATGGIQFVQVDLESVAEFYEPEVKEQIKRIKSKLGMVAGLHGESGELMGLDSAEKRIWEQTHLRLCQTVKYAAELGFFYVNVHFSNKQLISFTEAQHRTQGYFYPVVGPDGKGLPNIIKNSPQLHEEAKQHMEKRIVQRSKAFRIAYRDLFDKKLKQLPELVEQLVRRELERFPEDQRTGQLKKEIMEDAQRRVNQHLHEEAEREAGTDDFAFNIWLNMGDDEQEKYQLEDGEWGAYHLVARWMKERGDYFWSSIARGQDPQKLYFEEENEFCAAVASKYIEGHIVLKDHWVNKKFLDGMSIKEWCEKHKLYLLLENPESGEGAEGLYRLFHPNHFYHTIKKIGSPFVKVTIDFEHMVSQKLDPDDVLPKMPGDFGKMILLFHLGQPVPYGGMAHIPISRGSLAQEQIYRWLYWMRKKGWTKGYIMFERGAGRAGSGRSPYEVFEDSVIALRQIVAYLPNDIEPKKLPPEFFGISASNPDVWARQQVAMREHAWDPLEGMLQVPEEKHTFFGKSAVDKGKAQEWEKRKFR